MQMAIRSLFKDKYFLISVVITLLLLYLSLRRIDNFPIQFSQVDKVEHIIAYTFLTLSWLFTFRKIGYSKKVKYRLALAILSYGIIIEVLQGTLTTYRTASFLDVLADTVGIGIAFVIFKNFFKKIKAI